MGWDGVGGMDSHPPPPFFFLRLLSSIQEAFSIACMHGSERAFFLVFGLIGWLVGWLVYITGEEEGGGWMGGQGIELNRIELN